MEQYLKLQKKSHVNLTWDFFINLVGDKLQKKSHVNLTWDFFINLGGDKRLDPVGFFFGRRLQPPKKKILRGPGACRLLGL